MRTLVISGSAKETAAVEFWRRKWTAAGFEVVDYPAPIPEDRFVEDYPTVFSAFFGHLRSCDVLFVMNENRGDTIGYVGAATFAELTFAIARNALGERPVEIILANEPSEAVHCIDEIRLWASLGWVRFHSET